VLDARGDLGANTEKRSFDGDAEPPLVHCIVNRGLAGRFCRRRRRAGIGRLSERARRELQSARQTYEVTHVLASRLLPRSRMAVTEVKARSHQRSHYIVPVIGIGDLSQAEHDGSQAT
jgi:hypothetical protein